MTRRTCWAASGLLVLLLMPAGAPAPYLQDGVDAGRTGFTSDPGPAALDRAYTLAFGGVEDGRTILAGVTPTKPPNPIILDDVVVIPLMLRPQSDGVVTSADPDGGRLISIQISTGQVLAIRNLTHDPSALASDGITVFIASGPEVFGVDPYSLEDTIAPVQLPSLPQHETTCTSMAYEDGLLYAGCVLWPFNSGFTASTDPQFHVLRLTTAGAIEVHFASGPVGEDAAGLPDDSVANTPGLTVHDMALGPDEVVVLVNYVAGVNAAASGQATWRLARDDLSLIEAMPQYGTAPVTDPAFLPDMAGHANANGASVVSTADAFLELSRDFVLNPYDGSVSRRIDLDSSQSSIDNDPGDLAVRGRTAYAATAGNLHAIDLITGIVDWTVPMPGSWGPGDTLLAAGDHLFLASRGTLMAFDLRTQEPIPLLGEALFRAVAIAIGDSVLVALSPDADVHVFGVVPASIQVEARVDNLYPGIGKSLEVHFEAPFTGAFDDAVTWRIEWGDGLVDDMPSGPATHAYVAAGDYTLQVMATNGAGQERSWQTTIHAGQQSPNFVSSAFAPDNQESTFFLLGIIVILLGSAFGAVRLRRKRGRLRRELAAADRVAADHRHDPDAMREALRDQRARARRLFLDGRLDEGSASLLERHIDELLRAHRLSSVEEAFAFLPHGLFRGLQEILADARVSSHERYAFLDRLAASGLPAAQQRKVRERVESWHREDAA